MSADLCERHGGASGPAAAMDGRPNRRTAQPASPAAGAPQGCHRHVSERQDGASEPMKRRPTKWTTR